MKEGWEYIKIGAVCQILNGFAFKSSKYVEDGFRVIRITNVQKGVIIDDAPKYYPSNEQNNIRPYLLKENDLLISLTGNVGRVGLMPSSLLNSQQFEQDCIFNASGIAQKNMSTEWLKNYTIPVPSINMQQHIIEELDLLNSIIEKKKSQLNELDNLAQSLFYEMFGDPITNEKGWEINSLKEVCLKINDGTHNSPVNEEKGDYMYVTAKNIKKDGIVLDNITFVSYDVHRSIYERCNPELGDVLYIKDGATTGIATINTLHDEFSLLSSVALLKPSNSIVNQYLKAVLNTPSMYNVIRSDMGGAAITRLTIAKINKIRIPIPPIDLQQQFASKIEDIEHQKELIKQSIKEVETLFNSRMDYYFS